MQTDFRVWRVKTFAENDCKKNYNSNFLFLHVPNAFFSQIAISAFVHELILSQIDLLLAFFFLKTFTGSFWRIERFGDEFRVRRNCTGERSISGVWSLCEHLSWSGKWDNTNRGSYTCHDVCVETDHSKSNYVDTNYWEFVVTCSGTSNKLRSFVPLLFPPNDENPYWKQVSFCVLSLTASFPLAIYDEGRHSQTDFHDSVMSPTS